MSQNDVTASRLDLIAAQAAVLASDYRNGKLWPGQLEQGLGEIGKQIAMLPSRGDRDRTDNIGDR